MPVTCMNCFSLKATIPLISRKGKSNIFKKELNYLRATAKCSKGHLVDINGEDKIFKNVLKICNPRISFKIAENCPDFDSE